MNELITPTQDDTKAQPSALSIKTACVLFAGPVVTFRSFKQGAPRSLRGIADTEFTAAIEDLQNSSWGTVRRLRIPRTANQVKVFVKQEPEYCVAKTTMQPRRVQIKIPTAIAKEHITCDQEGVNRKQLRKQRLVPRH